jgi:MGT family glycosyltransferase
VTLLAYTSPARGHLYPVLGILAELAQRGERCVACTLEGERGSVESVGAVARAIDPRIEQVELDDWRARTPWGAIRSALETFGGRADLEIADLREAIAEHDPDVVLVDVNCWGAAAAAEASGRPWAMVSPYLLPLPAPGLPPFGPGLAPLAGRAGAARDALARRLLTGVFDRAAAGGVNRARRRAGLAPVADYAQALGRAPLLVYLTAEAFEYPRRVWPPNLRFVGPINWSPPAQAPPALAALPDPIVLATCSSERQGDRRLVDSALKALPGAGYSVIATTAAHDPATFATPTRTLVVRFLAHHLALDRAVCVVCHAGMGITQRALSAGVPVVAVPFGRDQLETARRVAVAQAGVRITPRRLTATRLISAVQTATARGHGARTVARAYSSAGGAPAAADALRALAPSPHAPDE